jgi:hypothetical protein
LDTPLLYIVFRRKATERISERNENGQQIKRAIFFLDHTRSEFASDRRGNLTAGFESDLKLKAHRQNITHSSNIINTLKLLSYENPIHLLLGHGSRTFFPYSPIGRL